MSHAVFGSAIWGKVAAFAGLPAALTAAAVGALAVIPLLWRWELQTGASLDLTPSMHWPELTPAVTITGDRGPVLVTVAYEIRPDDRTAFLAAIADLSTERRRDGAFDWDIFEDLARPGCFVEEFKLDSWNEHLRQHERVTGSDAVLQQAVNRFQVHGAPKVSHLISSGF